jgi:hypothetical protein
MAASKKRAASTKRSAKTASHVDDAFERVEAVAALLASAAALLWVVYDMSDDIRQEWRRLRGSPSRPAKRSAARAKFVGPIVVDHRDGDHHVRN